MEHTRCCGHHHEPEHGLKEWLREYYNLLLSFVLLVMGLIFGTWFQLPFTAVALYWYGLAYLPVGIPVWVKVWEKVIERDFFNEFSLMSLASVGAFCIGEYPEGVAVMLFYSIGEALQDNAVSTAKRNIGDLLDVKPERVTLVEGSVKKEVDPETVRVGQIVEVKAGERVGLDGVLLTRMASFNAVALTGESTPRLVNEGEDVLAGMIALDNVALVEVTKVFEKSMLSRILDLVRESAERKTATELFISKFARVYTPIVVALTVAIVLVPYILSLLCEGFGFTLKDYVYRALVFLTLSCPCAFVFSIPLGYFAGIGLASAKGILFKGSKFLDAVAGVNTVLFDKTGTLTKGVFQVTQISCAGNFPKNELLRLVAMAERNSLHPIAKAIVRYAQTEGMGIPYARQEETFTGLGVRAFIGGSVVLAGNRGLLQRFGVSYPPELDNLNQTFVAAALDGVYLGYLVLADTLKEDALCCVEALRKLGVNRICVLSGDKQGIVDHIASQLGITEAYGELLPEGKVHYLEALTKDPKIRVAFVGDGMNDAPVLALSNVGISMGGLGSDMAIETADVVIQTDRPTKVAQAIKIGRLTRNVVRQNIVLAFVVKLGVLCLGAIGMATLWEAVFADVGVALLVIINSARMRYTSKL